MRILFKKITSLSFLYFVNFCFCSGQQGIVTGKVLGVDGVLQAATVSAGGKTILTNIAGEFSITLGAGSHTLLVTHSGYKQNKQQVQVVAGKITLVELNMSPHEMLGEVVVLGSRSNAPRSNLFTAVPVDVISSEKLMQTGLPNLTQMLQFAVPSFNASRQLTNEPITLRGLDPDQTLILVNNKRFHNLAFMNFGGVRGMLGRGAVSNDLNTIPYSAIEKIEVLRDGASAQYGSDAIAGVINIQLKKNSNEISARIHTGQFYKNDGETLSIGINRGFVFIKKGFLNLSGTFRFQNPTYRGGDYNGTVYTNNAVTDDSIVRARSFNRGGRSNAGSSEHRAINLSMNGGSPVGRRSEFFWTAGMNHRKTIFSSFYIFPKNTTRINPLLFPDGFHSKPISYSNDLWGVTGVKGKIKSNWLWEYSTTYGTNTAKYYNSQTNNASQFYALGKDAPTSFYTGFLGYGQLVNNIFFSKNIFSGDKKMMSLAFGSEWRYEHFRIKEGEEASWKNYNPSGNKLGGSGGLVFSPSDAIKENRNVISAYVDLEREYKTGLLVTVASRYEYYSDFGGNLAVKVAIRYKLSDRFSVRASASNGFRAPSLQQRYWSFTRPGFSLRNGVVTIGTLGIFRSNSDVAKAIGIAALSAEKSLNLSGGVTGVICQQIRFTVDAYWIQIKNRIVLSGIFDTTSNPGLRTLLINLTPVNQVQFFANAINTRTKGMDIILNGNWKINNARLEVVLGANITQTRLYGDVRSAGNLLPDPRNTNTLFGREERGKLEYGQPRDKVISSLYYKTGRVGFMIRNTKFGRTGILSNTPQINSDEFFDSRIITDLNISYAPKKWLSLTIGAHNIFNVYPERLRDYDNTGEGVYIYGQEATPFGINGGYYFISIGIKH